MASVDGLASGLNTTDIIKQLMQLERQPQVRLQSRQRVTETAITALRALNTKFLSIGTAAEKLGAPKPTAVPSSTTPSDWAMVKAASSDTTRVSASAVTGAPAASLSFHVKQLATAATGQSAGTWSSTADAFGTGTSVTLTKDGVATAIPTGTGSLADTAAAINKANAGVTASVVQTVPGTYMLAMSATTTGASGDFTLADGAGTVVVRAENGLDAELDVAGVLVTRSSNTISDVLEGVTLTLAKVSASDPPVTVSVTKDDEGVAERVAALVDAANAAAKELKSLTSADPLAKTKGQLYGDSSVRALVDQIRTAVTGGTADAALAGVTVSRDGTIVLDKDVLLKSLATDPAAVEAALGKDGMAGRLQTLVHQASRTATDPEGSGVLTRAVESREGLVTGLKSSIVGWDNRLARREQTLQRQYASLERALGAVQSQGQWLSGQLANLPKWS
jgi:flagellar hook-associated protein 2